MSSKGVWIAFHFCSNGFLWSDLNHPWRRPDDRQRAPALLALLPRSEPWEEWLKKTGELPPISRNCHRLPLPDPSSSKVSEGNAGHSPKSGGRAGKISSISSTTTSSARCRLLQKTCGPRSSVLEGGGPGAQEVELEFGPATAPSSASRSSFRSGKGLSGLSDPAQPQGLGLVA